LRPTISAEQERTQRGSQQRGRSDQALFELRDLPLAFEQRHHHADDEEVIGVGKEAHAGDEHDLPVVLCDAGVIEFGEVCRSMRGRVHRAHSQGLDARPGNGI
jgi:hypothetical protein